MRTKRYLQSTLLVALIFSINIAGHPAFAQRPPMPDIGPTLIPFFTGNIDGWGGGGPSDYYWGATKTPPGPGVTPELISQLKSTSQFGIVNYAYWYIAEQEPGRWDFSIYRDNAMKLHVAGIHYCIYSVLQFPPKWFLKDPRFVPYRSLEGGVAEQLSLWAPFTRTIYKTYYAHLAKAMGDQIDFIRLGMPSDFGEIGYPAGMLNIINDWMHKPKPHRGFWCGDRYARQSFGKFAMKRYRTLSSLNAAWGTRFHSESEITYPSVTPEAVVLYREPEEKAARVWWLDFMDWYDRSLTDFMVWSAGVVKHDFPGFGLRHSGKDLLKDIIVNIGYGNELPEVGNDEGRIVAAMGGADICAETPGALGYFATRRVSSACALYGVPNYTEPPNNVDRDAEVQRIWTDASDGVQGFFDYPANLLRARDLFKKYKRFLSGERSLTDIGVLFPTTTRLLHTEKRWDWPAKHYISSDVIQKEIKDSLFLIGWPSYVYLFSDVLRERQDYEVIGERMVADGALSRFGIHVLILANAEYLRSSTLKSITEWVRDGGLLISLQNGPVRSIDGSEKAWEALAPAKLPSSIDYNEMYSPDLKTLWKEWGRKVGKGYVLIVPGGMEHMEAEANAVAEISENLSEYFPGGQNSCRLQSGFDGSFASLFRNRILYYNATDSTIRREVRLRPADFEGGRVGKPAKYTFELTLPPHSIVSVPLKRIPVRPSSQKP